MANQEWWQQFCGETIDRTYYITSLIGVGSFGGVFRAEHRIGGQLLRYVAVKLVLPDANQREQQFAELQSQITTQNPYLLSCFHAGDATLRSTSFLFLVMELAEASLEQLLKQRLLPAQEVVQLANHAAAALQHLHQRKMVHRDIKPANILRVGDVWKVADFGLVRFMGEGSHTESTRISGTYSYMPPESFNGIISTGWDVWSLGVVLQEALTGVRPYRAETDGQLIAAILYQPPQIVAGISPPFDRIVSGCLERDRSQRWTIERVASALQPKVAQVRLSVPLPPKRLADPTPDEIVSSGDFWRAYLRTDPDTGEPIVLKTAPVSGDTRYLQQEYAALQRLDHPNITKVRSFDPAPGHMRLIVESIPGDVKLSQILSWTLFPVTHTSALFVPIFEALDHMHSRGVVHGLLRPQQILLEPGRLGYRPVIHGFALSSIDGRCASQEARLVSLLDLAYAAPEQLDSRSAPSPATDIYSAGQMFGELLRGQRYHLQSRDPAYSANAIYQKMQLEEPLTVDDSPWSVHTGLSSIVRECTSINPVQRPSAAEVAARLRRLLPSNLGSSVAYPWNLAFRVEHGGELPGWTNGVGIVGDAARGYRLGYSADGAERAIVLEAGPDVLPIEFGTLTQRSLLLGCKRVNIRLRGRVRAEGVTGRAALWIRGDTFSGGQLVHENMENHLITGDSGPIERTVEASLSKGVSWLNFGLLLSGRGRIHVSKLRLEVETPNGWRAMGW